jgi:hypothetical protein
MEERGSDAFSCGPAELTYNQKDETAGIVLIWWLCYHDPLHEHAHPTLVLD